jgi:hypothetical protein
LDTAKGKTAPGTGKGRKERAVARIAAVSALIAAYTVGIPGFSARKLTSHPIRLPQLPICTTPNDSDLRDIPMFLLSRSGGPREPREMMPLSRIYLISNEYPQTCF